MARIILSWSLVLGLSLLVVGVASAQAPFLAGRAANQERRIAVGVLNGSLTAPETRRLVAGEVHVQRTIHRAEANGVVTPLERARIQAELDRLSGRIAVQKHDAQVQHRPAIIPVRRVNQEARIENGIATGALTPREVVGVRTGQALIGQDIREARSDGRFSPAERARVQLELNWESDLIYGRKHN